MAQNPKTLPEQGTEFVLGSSGGWRDKMKNWLKNNSSIILAIGVILVLGGGIYAYNQSRSQLTFTPDDEFAQEETNPENEKLTKSEDKEEQADEQQTEKTKETEEKKHLKDKNQEELNITEDEEKGLIIDQQGQKVFKETAKEDEGITHLTRRALKHYLEKTGGDPELTKEHKVYIEDYLQNKTGQENLKIGETREFSQELIEESIHTAKQLNDQQLARITPYAQQANL